MVGHCRYICNANLISIKDFIWISDIFKWIVDIDDFNISPSKLNVLNWITDISDLCLSFNKLKTRVQYTANIKNIFNRMKDIDL